MIALRWILFLPVGFVCTGIAIVLLLALIRWLDY